MKKTGFNHFKCVIVIILVISMTSYGQNTTITDDNGYSPHNSAILDVKSITKGFLAPRLTTIQRIALVSPANGLIVYDTDINSYFHYSDNKGWVNLSLGGNLWKLNGSSVYLQDSTVKLGVGTSSSSAKLTIKADANSTVNDTLFVVKDKEGRPVLAVFPEGVQVIIGDGSKGNIGGFAVSGRTSGKGVGDYLKVTPDSTRIYVDENSKGNIGGFAVSGRTSGKSINSYMFIEAENYFIGKESGVNIDTGLYNSFLGYRSGYYTNFGFRNIFLGRESGYENMTGSDNIIIGDQAGYLNNGSYNIFLGNQAGYSNIGGIDWGKYNIFMGYKSGYTNQYGSRNFFGGFASGYTNLNGNSNVFIGDSAGFANTYGSYNTFVGAASGKENTGGDFNTFIGYEAGKMNSKSGYNVFIGYQAGLNNDSAQGVVFVGYKAGTSNTQGDNNTFMGNECGRLNTLGSRNTFYGTIAGQINQTGNDNTYIGYFSGRNARGNYNTCIGSYSGSSALGYLNTGYGNVTIGYQAGLYATNANKNVMIGYQAGKNELNSNRLYIANSATTSDTALIYGEFENKFLRLNARVGINVMATNNFQLCVVDKLASSDNPAIYGEHDVTDFYGIGVRGRGRYIGVDGVAQSATGSVSGLKGVATGAGTGVRYGIYASASGGDSALAGYFSGKVRVVGNLNITGTLSKASGSFLIDHPLDPENKYLYHSFVESPDMKNIYDGIIILDASGMAKVELPDWFCALNSDFRYQLTAIGKSCPGIYIETEINSNNIFIIAGGQPNAKISWQVTGIRKDPFAEKNRIPVEVNKGVFEKGKYLHPEVYGLPSEKGIFNHSINEIEKSGIK